MSESCTQHSGLFQLRQFGSTSCEGMSRNGDLANSTLLTTPAIVQDDSVNKTWSTYMEVAREYDKRMATTWKEDSMGLLVFVSTNPVIQLNAGIVIITSLDGSILYNCCHIPR
jgi:hypothetical protein